MAIHIRTLVLSDYLESVEKAIAESLGYLSQMGRVQLADRDEDASARRIRLVDFPESDVEISFRSNSPDRTTIPNVLADIESGRFDTLYDLVLIDDRWGKNEYGGQDLLMESVYRHVQGLVDELPLIVLYTRHWETDRLNRFFNRVRERGLDSNRLVPCRKEDFGQFLQILFRVLSTKRMAREKRQAQCESEETLAVLRTLGCKLEDTPQSHPNIIGNSIQMRALFALTERYAQSGSNVLITGETGTGKELFARALHDASPRKNSPYFAFNSAGLTDTLAESELFGHEQGAFTDAVTRHIGYFELADGGTIFMDEIGDMSPRIQAKLLRVLEDGTYRRVGGTVPLACNVRIISATNKNIRDLVEKKLFRDDLYYRLSKLELELPPLRERESDIRPLVNYLIERYCQKEGREPPGISEGALEEIMDHVWPGNVRHLSNCIERALNNSGFGTIRRNHLGDLDRDRLGNPRKSRGRGEDSAALPRESLFKRFLREGIVRDNAEDLAWRLLKSLTDLAPNESLEYDELVKRLGPENCDPEEFKRSLITTCSRLRSEMKAARIGWTIQSGSAKRLIQE